MLHARLWSAFVLGQALFVSVTGILCILYSQQLTWVVARVVGEERYFSPQNVDTLWEDGHWELKIPESFNLFNLLVLTVGVVLILTGLTLVVLWRAQKAGTASTSSRKT